MPEPTVIDFSAQKAAIVKEAAEIKAKLDPMVANARELSDEETKQMSEYANRTNELKAAMTQISTNQEALKWLYTPESPFVIGAPVKDSELEIVPDPSTGAIKCSAIKGLSLKQYSTIHDTSYRNAWMHMLEKGGEKAIYGSTDFKILQEGQDAAGGFLVPEQILQILIMKKPAPTSTAERCRRLQTSRDSLTVPQVIYATDDIHVTPVRYTETGELPLTASTATYTDPVFGQARIEVFTQMLNGALTRDMIEDSLFDVEGFLGEMFRLEMDLLYDNLIMTGTGNAQPVGIVTNPGGTVGNATMPAAIPMGNPITPDGVVDLPFEVPPQYEDNLAWYLNKNNSMRGIARMVDSNKRYLFTEGDFGDTGIATSRPKKIVGYPYYYNQFLPNSWDDITGADGNDNAFPIVFGDLTGYYLVERVGLSIQVLDQIQALQNQLVLVGRLRFGGQPVEYWKMKVGQVA